MRILIFLLILIQIINIINGSDIEYFTFRKDLRKCASPMCGGYFFKRINSEANEKEMHVTGLSLINANLKPNKMDDEKNVIVSGEITLTDKDQGLYSFFLKGIHSRMVIPPTDDNKSRPRKGVAAESYGFLSNSGIACIQAKGCPVLKFSKINTNETTNFATYTEPYTTSVSLLDKNWFSSRLIKTDKTFYVGSIVLGSISKGELTVSSIFVNTEDPALPCPENPSCTGGKIQTFARSLDRCPIFNKCVNKGVCHLGIPHCPVGYTSYSIPSAPNGCLKYYCDPDSLPNPSTVLGP
ncbi:hypothetical protein ACTFIZ_012081 [Dictyostelium cf. discoideum]